MKLLDLTCPNGARIAAAMYQGLALTLLAMDADGRDRTWERLCAAPADLPDRHGTAAAAAAGRAFRLNGTREQVVTWSAAGIYGSTLAHGSLDQGPLYRLGVMVNANARYDLVTYDLVDHPHYDPARGRHFGWVSGHEWGPVDAELEPNVDYVTGRANGDARFHRAWGRTETVLYLGEMARAHLLAFGAHLGIGDVSLPTGGDISDHGSHEVGLDADLYLFTFDPGVDDAPDLEAPHLWVSECDPVSGGWDCWYWDNADGSLEDPTAPGHVAPALQLEGLAQHAYEHPGPSWFVQNDYEVIRPFRSLPSPKPIYVDESNAAAYGWPPHKNHLHLRFSF